MRSKRVAGPRFETAGRYVQMSAERTIASVELVLCEGSLSEAGARQGKLAHILVQAVVRSITGRILVNILGHFKCIDLVGKTDCPRGASGEFQNG